MEAAQILEAMKSRLSTAIDNYEAGEPTIGRKVDMHEEALGALIEAVSTLGIALSNAELKLAER